MSYGNSDPDKEFRWAFRGLIAAILIGLLGFFSFGSVPSAAPTKELVFGCYGAANAPSISLNRHGAMFAHHDRALPFNIDRTKTGIMLSLEDSIDLHRVGVDYEFVVSPSGTGRRYPFIVRSGDKSYYVMSEHNLDIFHITADDGRGFEYRRQPTHLCSGIDTTA